MHEPYCAVCNRDHQDDPTLVLARWQDQDICTDCLENRPGKEEAEAEAQGERHAVIPPPARLWVLIHEGNFGAAVHILTHPTAPDMATLEAWALDALDYEPDRGESLTLEEATDIVTMEQIHADIVRASGRPML
jgi:hypothetical protein